MEQASSTDIDVERLEWIKNEIDVDEFHDTPQLGPSNLPTWSPQHVEQHVEQVFGIPPIPIYSTESVQCNLPDIWMAPVATVPAVGSAWCAWSHGSGAQDLNNTVTAQPAAVEEDAIFVDMAQYLEESHWHPLCEQFRHSKPFERCGSKRKADDDYLIDEILQYASE